MKVLSFVLLILFSPNLYAPDVVVRPSERYTMSDLLSDERLKDFEGKIPNALDKVSQLNGYYFKENETAKDLGFNNDLRQVGVSAQEVEAIMPEIIKSAPINEEHGTDYKTVQYEKMVPLLIEAIKELKEEGIGAELIPWIEDKTN